MPEDLPAQIERCREIAEAFSIPVYEAATFEADDVLATLADQAVEAGFDTWICHARQRPPATRLRSDLGLPLQPLPK